MNLHIPAGILFIAAFALYWIGQFDGGVLAAGIAFILEAKAWSQVFRRGGPTNKPKNAQQ